MENYKFEGKSADEILKAMQNRSGDTIETFTAALQVRTTEDLCRAISASGTDFVKQSNALIESIAGAREDFIRMTGESIRKIDDLKISINQFRKSSERTSKALYIFTAVIALTGLFNLILLLFHK